jgi:hypothetical protein
MASIYDQDSSSSGSPPPKNSITKLIVFVFLILIILLTALYIYLTYLTKKTNRDLLYLQTMPAYYRNQQENFRIKIPTGWEVHLPESIETNVLVYFTKSSDQTGTEMQIKIYKSAQPKIKSDGYTMEDEDNINWIPFNVVETQNGNTSALTYSVRQNSNTFLLFDLQNNFHGSFFRDKPDFVLLMRKMLSSYEKLSKD